MPLSQKMIWKVAPACARFPGSRSSASPWCLCILVQQILLAAPEFPCFLLPPFLCFYLGLRVCFPFGPGVGGFHVSLCFAFCRNGTLVCCVSLCRFGRCRSRVQFRMPVFRTPRFAHYLFSHAPNHLEVATGKVSGVDVRWCCYRQCHGGED